MSVPRDVVELVKKNVMNLIRSKVGSLVVILGPLLVIVLAGLAFDNSNVYAVRIGTFRPDANELTGKFVEQLHGQFKVIEFKSEKECVDAIKKTDVNTCLVFAQNFQIGRAPNNQVTFYVDYSRINLVYAVTRAMTQKVNDRALQASADLTKILVETLDFTQGKVANERAVIVRLATQNELMNKNAQDLLAELGDMDLSLNPQEFPIENITRAKTQVKQWSDNAISIGERGLSKATGFIGAANDLVKNSAASADVKNNYVANFQQNVEDIKKLQADFETTKTLTKESYEEFDREMTALAGAISSTKNRLDEADAGRQFSVRVLESLRALLDKSLLSVLEVQQSLNDIEGRINAIEIKDPQAISQPIVTTIKPIVQEKTYLHYLFPVLVVLVIMFTALLLTPTLILLDKNSPASFRSFMTPVNDISYVLAHFVTAFIILLVQVVIILAIVSMFFKEQMTSVPKALLILLLVNTFFILLGMVIGYLFSSEETATLAGVSVGALLLFLSDVIIPLESMPEAISYIASFNPYVLGSSLLRRVLLFNSSIHDIFVDLSIMVGYVIALALVATGVYLLTKRYSLQQLMKDLAPVLAKVHIKKK